MGILNKTNKAPSTLAVQKYGIMGEGVVNNLERDGKNRSWRLLDGLKL